MDSNNSNFQGHPFYVALTLFNAAVKTPFDIAVAFWRPWFVDAGKEKVQGRQRSDAPPTEISLSKTETQLAAVTQQLAAVPEKMSRPTKRKQTAVSEKISRPMKRKQTPKPQTKNVQVEKEPKPPTKRTLKEELELEREERAQKTERLRKLRQIKDAADSQKMPLTNGRGGARRVPKH